MFYHYDISIEVYKRKRREERERKERRKRGDKKRRKRGKGMREGREKRERFGVSIYRFLIFCGLSLHYMYSVFLIPDKFF